MLTLLTYTLGEKSNVHGLKGVRRVPVKALLGKPERGRNNEAVIS